MACHETSTQSLMIKKARTCKQEVISNHKDEHKMKKISILLILAFALINTFYTNAQSISSLRQKINGILQNKAATVGVAIRGETLSDTLSINGDMRLPMQSVFKFHLVLAVLHQVDIGKLSLDDDIHLDKTLIKYYTHLWSPLREKYPNGAQVTLSEIIEYTVAWSDNLGCDVLFELLGGTEAVQRFLHDIGIKDIAIVHNELIMQSAWPNQFENWTTAKAANQSLQIFYENRTNVLSLESHRFLLNILKGTKTGKKRIRGLLPKDAEVAHKTGTSGKNKNGLTGATNDIGIVFLPNGDHFYLSVLVCCSMESDDTNEQIIAEISKLVWNYFLHQ